MIRVDEVENDSYLVMVTRNGTIKRTALSATAMSARAALSPLTWRRGDELAWVRNTTGEDDLIIATRQVWPSALRKAMFAHGPYRHRCPGHPAG